MIRHDMAKNRNVPEARALGRQAGDAITGGVINKYFRHSLSYCQGHFSGVI
jgi:hypothetical protein